MIIDIHGHFTTAPPQLDAYRGRQLAAQNKPAKGRLIIGDEELTRSLQGHLDQMGARGTDRVFFSPRASSMGHDVGSELVSRYWTEINNELIHRVCGLFPDKFVPVCQLPQSPGATLKGCVEELERSVLEMGFVGCNINPDVSGGLPPLTPSLGDEWWYPLWEKMVELDVPGMIHASSTRNPAIHLNGSHYINQDYAAAFELCGSRVFEDFPTLKLIVPHGGGSIPFQFNRSRSLHISEGKIPFEEAVRKLYFDTSVYDADSVEMLVRKIGADNILFGAEMFGTAKSKDPLTGKYFDDNAGFITAIPWLSEGDRKKIFEENALRVFPRAEKYFSREKV